MIYDIIPSRISHTARIFITLFLSILTFQRNNVWTTDFTLWQDAAKKSHLKARAHNNLGRAYEKNKAPEEALKEYLEAVRLKPRYAPGHSNLAGIYMKEKRWGDAEVELKLAITLGPPFEDLHRRLGFIYIKKGLTDDAIKEFEKAKTLIPDHPDARRIVAVLYTNEAWQYTDKGDFPAALLLHGTAVSIDPSYPNSHFGLAQAYEAFGQKEEAIIHWQEYMRLAPQDEPFRNNAMKHLERLR